MNWDKILSVLKIPLKVLLPAVCLVSGFFVFANEDILVSLEMLQWKQENSFLFGLLFLLSACFILVYIFWFVVEKVSKAIRQLTLPRRTAKSFMKMSAPEISIILGLYKSPNHTHYLDFNEPIVQGLLSKEYIYMGSRQEVIPSNNHQMLTKFTLQPFVYQTMDYLVKKLWSEINKTENKLKKTKNEKQKAKLQTKLDELKEYWGNYKDFEV